MTAVFSEPTVHFSDIDAKTVGDLIANASDISLVIDRDGLVVDVAGSSDSLVRLGAAAWAGQKLEAIVSENSVREIGKLLAIPSDRLVGHECTITHETPDGEGVAIRYTAVLAGSQHTIVLLGRDLSPLRSLQHRLLSSQQSMELSLERHRNNEARYRMLFQVSCEPIVVVDASSGKITEINRAAGEMLGLDPRAASNRRFSALFGKTDRAVVDDMLTEAAEAGSAATNNIGLEGQDLRLSAKTTLFRTGETSSLLVQLNTEPSPIHTGSADQSLVSLIHRAAEAVILTDEHGVIMWANATFVDLVQAGVVDSLIGQTLGDYFNGAELDIPLTLENVRRHGRIKYVIAKLYGATGQISEVELSVVAIPEADPPSFGVVMRSVMPQVTDSTGKSKPAGSGEAIEKLVGRVPLKELVREEIDVVEKNCIETALRLTGNNRAATAKVLGLSRQGLYTKMRRYGLLSGEE